MWPEYFFRLKYCINGMKFFLLRKGSIISAIRRSESKRED